MEHASKNKTTLERIWSFLYRRKFEILLFGLLQHLFLTMFVTDIDFYVKDLWPVSMIVLGLSSFGIYEERNRIHLSLLQILVLVICVIPFVVKLTGFTNSTMILISVSYAIYFSFVFAKVLMFLLKPSYINVDVIFASVCGYLLLIEIAVFMQQWLFYVIPNAYSGLDVSHPTLTFVDFVYFSTVITTSTGFGDILPSSHTTKLLVSLIGIIGQLYSVVLVGILISKFASGATKAKD